MDRLNVDVGIRRCLMNGCDRKQNTRGLCSKHYQRIVKAGLTDRPKCLHCDSVASPSTGLCQNHARRLKRWGDPVALFRGLPAVKPPCSVDDCEKTSTVKGLCQKHYLRLRQGIPLDYVKPARTWTRRIYKDGYAYVPVPGGKRLEHSVVMEAHLGRAMLPKENVHHINGDRADNRIENLELWSSSQPPGQRVVDKVAWAKELLTQYEPDALADGVSKERTWPSERL